jgi:hypothetical protein
VGEGHGTQHCATRGAKKTDAAIDKIDKLNSALHAALADAKVQKTLEDGGAIVGGIMKVTALPEDAPRVWSDHVDNCWSCPRR